ncbi:MAG: magnesium transporter [Nanoarchaeota archaeon]|nr:magnesium transporter [Nanoarchaeota archaeon]
MNYIKKIIQESLPVLLLASVITILGGIGLKTLEEHITQFLPFIIMLPALNNMVGDYSIVIVSKLTTHLYREQGKKPELGFIKHLFKDTTTALFFSTAYMILLTLIISSIKHYPLTTASIITITAITSIVVATMFIIAFLIAITFALYAYKHHEDPDDVLIPITTSLADLGSIIILIILLKTF